MTLEEINALVTIPDLSGVVKDGMCCSEPVMCLIDREWIDVFFTYAVNYDEESYSGPISVFGIDSEKKKVVFIKNSGQWESNKSGDDIVYPADWKEENSVYYDQYAEAYEQMRKAVLSENPPEDSAVRVSAYIDLLRKYVDEALWDFYSVLLGDLQRLTKEQQEG